MVRTLRFGFIVLAIAGGAGLAFVGARQPAYDLLIRGGRIVDGTGNPWFAGDVGIRADRIVAVGRLAGATATREVDARGLVVAPGFIDLHTHSDMPLLNDGNAESKVRQGVTLDVLGESTSVAPRDGLPAAKGAWTDFTGYWQALRQKGISMNVISEVSFQQIRLVVMGYAPGPATAAQLERMKQLTARSMQEGAWGLVTRFESGGPEYPYEVLALAKVAASHGGIYVSHIGSEGMQQDKELDFALRVAEEAKIPVHVFHLKIRGKKNWGTVGQYLAKIEGARARARCDGQSVSVHGHAARLERVLPGLGARGWARRIRVGPEGSGDAPEDQTGQRFSDLGARARLVGRHRARARAPAAEQEV
jgi:N-acyl-D-amino-acid deacylase